MNRLFNLLKDTLICRMLSPFKILKTPKVEFPYFELALTTTCVVLLPSWARPYARK